MTIPAWGLTMTFRPGAVPTSALSVTTRSFQKSLCEMVETRLASLVAWFTAERPMGLIVCPGNPAPGAWPAPAAPAPWAEALCDTAPELTRRSLRPERKPTR